MSITFHFNRKHRLITSIFDRLIDDTQFGQYVDELFVQTDRPPDFDEIVDLTTCDFSALSSGAIHSGSDTIENSLKNFSTVAKTAIVAPGDLSFGLSRMYGVYNEHANETVRVFRTVEDALRWLGRTEDALVEE